jgi:hypothetical protein
MMKSRHLAAIAVGTCVGLAGVGQVAFASRGNHHDSESASSCSSSQSNGSDNETGDVEQSGLINVGGIALQGLNLGILDNLLCHGDLLNSLTAGVLGRAFGAEADDDDDDAEGSCGMSQENDSENETGDVIQDGLINVGGIALQGTNLSALNNVLCGGNVANGLLAGILGGAFGGGFDADAADDSCNSSQDIDSENETGVVVGLGGLLNVGGIALQGNNIGALDNLLCGSNILNDVTAAVLGIASRF